MQAKLLVSAGKATTSEIVLKLPAVVGRAKEAGVRIVHPSVSRRHCEIYELDGALVVRDLGSTNGTYLGTERVDEAVVKPGDELTIGPLTFRAAYAHSGKFPVLGAKETAQLKTSKMPVEKEEKSKAPAAKSKSKTIEGKEPPKKSEKSSKPEKSKPAPKPAPAVEETLFFDAESEEQPIDEMFESDSPAAAPAAEGMDDFFASLASGPADTADADIVDADVVEEEPASANTIDEEAMPWGDEENLDDEKPEAPAIFDSVEAKTIDEVPDFDRDDAPQERITAAEPAADEDAFAAWLSESPAEPNAAEPEAAPEMLTLGEDVEELSFDDVAEAASANQEPIAEEDPFATWLAESQGEATVESEAAAEPEVTAEPEIAFGSEVAEASEAAEPEMLATVDEIIDEIDELSFDDIAESPVNEEPVAEPPVAGQPVADAEPVAEDDAFAAWLNESAASPEPEATAEVAEENAAEAAEIEAFEPIEEVDELSFDEVAEAAAETPADEPPAFAEPAADAPIAEEDAFAAWLSESESPAEPEAVVESETLETVDEVEELSFDDLIEEAPMFAEAEDEPIAELPAAEEPVAETPAADDDALAAWLGESEAEPIAEAELEAEALSPVDELVSEPTSEVADEIAELSFDDIVSSDSVETPAAEEPIIAQASPSETVAADDDLAAWLGEPEAPVEAVEESSAEVAFAPAEEEPVASDFFNFAAESDVESQQVESLAFDLPSEAAEEPSELELEAAMEGDELAFAAESDLSMPDDGAMPESDEEQAEGVAWDFLTGGTPPETVSASPELLSSQPIDELTDDEEIPELELASEADDMFAELGLSTDTAPDAGPAPLDTSTEDELTFAAFADEPRLSGNEVSGDEASAATPSDEFALVEPEPDQTLWPSGDQWGEAPSDVISDNDESLASSNGDDEFSLANGESDIGEIPIAGETAMFGFAEASSSAGIQETVEFDPNNPFGSQANDQTPIETSEGDNGFDLAPPPMTAAPVARVAEPSPASEPVKKGWWPFGRKSRAADTKPREPEPAASAINVRRPLPSIAVEPELNEATQPSASPHFMTSAPMNVAAASAAMTTALSKRRINIAAGPSGELDTLDVMFPPIETVPPVQPIAENDVPAVEAHAIGQTGSVEPDAVQLDSVELGNIEFDNGDQIAGIQVSDAVEDIGALTAGELVDEGVPTLDFDQQSAPESQVDEFTFFDEPTTSEAEAAAASEEPVESPAAEADLDATVMWNDESIPVLDFEEGSEQSAEPFVTNEFTPSDEPEITFDDAFFAEPEADAPAATPEVAEVVEFGEPEAAAPEVAEPEFTNELVPDELVLNGSQESDDDFMSFLNDDATPTEDAAPVDEEVISFADEPPAGDPELPTPESSQADASGGSASDDDGLADFLRELGK